MIYYRCKLALKGEFDMVRLKSNGIAKANTVDPLKNKKDIQKIPVASAVFLIFPIIRKPPDMTVMWL